MGFVVLARLVARPEAGEKISEVLDSMTALSRSEEKCLRYESFVSLEDPDVFLVFEEYADESGYEDHKATTHFKEYVERVATPNLKERKILSFDGRLAGKGDI